MDMTTADRLCLVADHIENEPKTWDQNVWVTTSGSYIADPSSIKVIDCKTRACVCGWAVILSPDVDLHLFGDRWEAAGAELLGLTDACASALFDGDLNWWEPTVMADVLRRLSKCNEPRSFTDLTAVIEDAGASLDDGDEEEEEV